MTNSIFLAGASRGVGNQIARILSTKSEPATGNGVLTLDTHVAGSIYRADVATLVCKCLDSAMAEGKILSAFDRNMTYGNATYQEFIV
jgi:hypothetical protein